MKRLFRILVLFVFLVSCNKTPEGGPATIVPGPGPGVTLYGYVTSDGGEAVAGAVVSDGYEVTVTDYQGRYELKSAKEYGSVFVSVPSGYRTLSDGILPKFYSLCTKGPSDPERFDFSLLKEDQRDYRLLVFGDIHLADRKFTHDIELFRNFASEVGTTVKDSRVPVYALTLGDMTWDVYWTENHYGPKEYLSEIQDDFEGIQIFHTMGNHDNDPSRSGDAGGESTYQKLVAPNHYSFNIGSVHYIVLDDILYGNSEPGTRDFTPRVTDAQMEWLKGDLQYVDKATPVVVAMHIPLYKRDGSSNLYGFSDFIHCFQGYEYVQILSAHTHTVYNVDMLSRSIHIYENNTGAVCGELWMTDVACRSGMNLCGDGAPGGYRIVDVSGKGISWKYKGIACPEDFQFRTYDRNSFCLSPEVWTPHASKEDKAAFSASVGDYGKKSSSNQVLINIWDYDPAWKISVKENGKTLPVTRLTSVKDPLYLAVYEAYEYENGYSVSYPGGYTDHIFSVTASGPDTTLEIRITDRFGRVYEKTMTRPEDFFVF